MFTKLLIVGCGGFFGAASRFLVSIWTISTIGSRFPWGTLSVNAIGCGLIGALIASLDNSASDSAQLRLLLAVGFLGSFTTFSAFGLETLILWRDGEPRLAFANIVLQLVLCLSAVGLGTLIAERALGG